MRRDLTMDDLADLAELRLLAVLATYRQDGTVLLSPVWHEWQDGGFHVVTGSRDVKAAHLRRDPRASIVMCEHSPPYRGVEVRGNAQLLRSGPWLGPAVAVRDRIQAGGAAPAVGGTPLPGPRPRPGGARPRRA
jgi:PPOX class probable F420-dependent enzyme